MERADGARAESLASLFERYSHLQVLYQKRPAVGGVFDQLRDRRAAASLAKIPLKMADIKVTATVRLHQDDSGYFIDASLN